MASLPVLGPAVLPAAVVVAVLAVAAAWWRRGRALRPATRWALLAIALLSPVLAAAVVDGAWRPFAEPVGWATWVWLAPAVLVVGPPLLARVRHPRSERPERPERPRSPRRAAGSVVLDVALALCVVAAAALGINASYGAYRTAGDLLGVTSPDLDVTSLAAVPGAPSGPPSTEPPAARLRADGTVADSLGSRVAADLGLHRPAHGVVATVSLPATDSGFVARPALVYLPPAALAPEPPALPVVVLMAGQPGAPADFVRKADLPRALDEYAAHHDGRAPIVLAVDQLGGPTTNPLCSDTAGAKVATYLQDDVTAWLDANLGPAPSPEFRAVGGVSNGATCALQVAVRDPAAYPVAIVVAGELHPDLGGAARTIEQGFAGDRAAFEANDPLTLLGDAASAGAPTYGGSAAWFGVGADDARFGPETRGLRDAAQAAGMHTEYVEAPGAHTWDVWTALLPRAFTWYDDLTGVAR